MPSLPSRNKTLAIAVKKYAKADIRVFYSCVILPNLQLSSGEVNGFPKGGKYPKNVPQPIYLAYLPPKSINWFYLLG